MKATILPNHAEPSLVLYFGAQGFYALIPCANSQLASGAGP